jgi:oxygen-independent coproporphyrinogen III oxidase
MDSSLGLYGHFPFCLRVCDYCNFFVQALPPHAIEPQQHFMRALIQEGEARFQAMGDESVLRTLYLGGGTPALMSLKVMEEFLQWVEGHTPLSDMMEITLELDPHVATSDKVKQYNHWGINRLSVGVQSFDETVLRSLGRAQTQKQSLKTLARIVEEDFDHVSVDLIFGAPGQTVKNFAEDLRQALSFPIDHVSLYNLTYEPGTPLEARRQSGEAIPLDDDTEFEMYHLAKQTLADHGIVQYEISNFAKPGSEGKHNQNYWGYKDCLGLGPSAVSFQKSKTSDGVWGQRRHNIKNLAKYLSGYDGEVESIDKATAMGEYMMVGLRQIKGVEGQDFQKEFGVSLKKHYQNEITKGVDQGLLNWEDGVLRLTHKGLFLSNEILQEFLP